MSMRSCAHALTLATLILASSVVRADKVDAVPAEQRLAQLETAPTPPYLTSPQPESHALIQPQLLPPQQLPPPASLPLQPWTMFTPAPIAPPVAAAPVAAAPVGPVTSVVPAERFQMIAPEEVFKESPYRSPSWLVDFDLIPTFPQFTESEFGSWTDDGSVALRLTLGFEDDIGIGTRVRFWGFGQDIQTVAADIELGASRFDWDLYRRLYIEDAELVIGGGPIGAHLEFEFPQIDERARFNGGGGSVFGEAYLPLVHYRKTDIGSVFRARIGVLRGEWRDSGTPFVPDTKHDSMTITEVAWGIELRHRFGLAEDKYWLIRFLPEYQRWDSAWLGEFADSSIAFTGVNISFGLAW